MVLFLLIAVSAIFLFSSGLIPFAITGTASGSVYVPNIGEVRCVEGSLAFLQFRSDQSNVRDFVVGDFTVDSTVTFSSVASKANPNRAINTCDGAYCLTNFGSDPSIHISCDAGDRKLWEVRRGSSLVGYNQWVWTCPPNQSCSWVETRFGATSNSSWVDRVRYEENETLNFNSVCYKSPQFPTLGDMYYSPYYANFVYLKMTKVLRSFAEGSQLTLNETQGCLQPAIQQLTSNGAYNPSDRSLTWIEPSTGVERSLGIDSLPSALNIGQNYKFVSSWKLVSGLNIITTDTGKSYYVNPSARIVFNVTNESTPSGSYLIASSIANANPQCVNNTECLYAVGSGYQCNPDAGFVCEQKAGYCGVSTDCGLGGYVTEGTSYYFVSYSCVNNSCVESKVTKVCNPSGGSSPFNGCPSDKPLCSFDGSSCFAPISQKVACIGECCLESDLYFVKACPSGLVCQTNGGFVGSCIVPPTSTVCGDGYCDKAAGEDVSGLANYCPADCPVVDDLARVCAERNLSADGIIVLGYDLVEDTSSFLWSSGTTRSCQPIFNVPLIIGLVVIVCVVVVGLFVFQPFSGMKKRRRR